MAQYLGTADSIVLEEDEDGWYLRVDADRGEIRVRVHPVVDSLVSIGARLDDWLCEGRRSARQHQIDVDSRVDRPDVRRPW